MPHYFVEITSIAAQLVNIAVFWRFFNINGWQNTPIDQSSWNLTRKHIPHTTI